MTSINQLGPDYNPQPSDQITVWNQNSGQPRKASLSSLINLINNGLQLQMGLLNASSLYALRRTQAETVGLTTTPTVIAPYDANGNSVVKLGGESLTMNVTTGLMQATRVIQAADFWVALVGSLPSPRVMTLQILTGPPGGPYSTSEFQSVSVGTGATQSFHFAGILNNPNNINSQMNQGDVIQLAATVDENTTLTLARASMIVQPLDGV